jgi:hypothetical protein
MMSADAVPNELQLTRTRGDRRLYALQGVGTLRLTGWSSRGAIAQAGALSWQIKRRGFSQRVIQAADASGVVVGEHEPRTLRRGGALRWCDRELALRPDSAWRQRYALTEGDHQLATIEGKSWGKRPVNIAVHGDASAIDPGLLLFAAFVVRTLAHDAAAASSAAGSTVIVSGG